MNNESYFSVCACMNVLLPIVFLMISGCAKIQYVNPDQGPYWPTHNVWHSDDIADHKPNDRALIIAVEDYIFLPDVEGANATSTEWQTFFRHRYNITADVLRDHDATKENVIAALEKIGQSETGRVWIVFVGHGAPDVDSSDGVLVGSDAQQNPESLRARGFTRHDLLSELPNKKVVMILDACFSGRTPTGESLAPDVQPVVPLNLKPMPASVTVLSAAETTQFAGQLPGTKRPAFSYLLLGALRGWGDADGDGKVSSKEALDFTTSALRFVPGRTQTPSLEGAPDLILNHGAEEPVDVQSLMRASAKHESEKDVFKIDTGEGIIVQTINGWSLPEYKTQMELFGTRKKGTTIAVEKMNAKKCSDPEAAVIRCKPKQVMAHMYHLLASKKTIGDHDGLYGAYWKPGLEETTLQYEVFVVQRKNALWRISMHRRGDARITEEERAVLETFIQNVEFTDE